jgi:hypothetical protein
VPYRGQISVTQGLSCGPVAYWLGRLPAVLGRLDEAHDHFAFAAELQERTGARGWLVQTRLISGPAWWWQVPRNWPRNSALLFLPSKRDSCSMRQRAEVPAAETTT